MPGVTRPDGGAAPARAGTAPRWLLAAAIAGTLAALALRVLATASAGPLWRDEAGSASTATVASLGEFWSRQWLDSFPVLWQLVLRFWSPALWNGGDTAIRTLGLVIGTALVPALWWTSRALGVLPLASLAAAATPLFVVWSGVQNRAYGLAVASTRSAIAASVPAIATARIQRGAVPARAGGAPPSGRVTPGEPAKLRRRSGRARSPRRDQPLPPDAACSFWMRSASAMISFAVFPASASRTRLRPSGVSPTSR